MALNPNAHMRMRSSLIAVVLSLVFLTGLRCALGEEERIYTFDKKPKLRGNVRYWIDLMSSGKPELSDIAKVVVGRNIGKPAVLHLIKLISDKPNMEDDAIEVLANIGLDAKEAVPCLLKVLQRQASPVLAIRALAQVSPEPSPELLALLKQANLRKRTNAFLVLQQMGPRAKASIHLLTKMMKDPDECLRVSAARTLGCVGRDALPILRRFLNRESIHYVCDALARMGPQAVEATADLERLLVGASADDEVLIRHALAMTGSRFEEQFPFFVKLSKHPDMIVRLRCIASFRDYRNKASKVTPLIVKGCQDQESEVRLAAVHSLVYGRFAVRNPELKKIIEMHAANDPNKEVRKEAKDGLRWIASDEEMMKLGIDSP